MKPKRIFWIGLVLTSMVGALLVLFSTAQANGPAKKIVHGTILTNTGEPVKYALVVARRIDRVVYEAAVTDANGEYEMLLSEGLWALTPRVGEATQPKAWIYPFGPQVVHFDFDDENERKQIDFRVITADSRIIGFVEMPDGSPPPFSATVKIHNDEGHGLSTTIDPSDGSFELDVPHGRYALTVHPDSEDYVGPEPLPVQPRSGQTLDVGTLTLVARDVTISGTVGDEADDPVEGVRVIGWTRHPANARDITDSGGEYELSAFEGTWHIVPSVPYTLPFIFTGEPVSLTAVSGDVFTDVDFTLTAAPNLVVGQLVDDQGNPVAAAGRGHAYGDNGRNGGPIEGDTFQFYLPDGDYKLKVDLAPGSGWLPGRPLDISLSGGETLTVEIPLAPQDAVLTGALWEPRRELTVTGVNAVVRAKSPYATVGTTINRGNGTYRLGVGAGLWHIGYRVDPQSGFVALDHHKIVPLESGQTLIAPLRVARRDARLNGVVLDPAGQPLAGAVVSAEGMGPFVDQLRLRTMSDETGAFSLPVPHGHYAVWAAYDHDEWLNPAVHHVVAPPNQAVQDIDLQFREPDVMLSGTTSVSGTSDISGTVHIWAYTTAGSATKTEQALGETYTLDLLSDSRWHLGAVLVDGPSYYRVRTAVAMTDTDQTLDLVLDGPHPLPRPVAITFEADETAMLNLADGTQLTIPAGAMPVSGTVTLHATPIATFPHQHHARLYKYGYAFIAVDEVGNEIEDFFNQEVEIVFTYEEDELEELGLNEYHLKPAYFSTTTNSWTVPDSYMVDTGSNTVTLYIDHFTDYSLMNGTETHTVMMPVVTR